jgi:hypothetical protein
MTLETSPENSDSPTGTLALLILGLVLTLAWTGLLGFVVVELVGMAIS